MRLIRFIEVPPCAVDSGHLSRDGGNAASAFKMKSSLENSVDLLYSAR